VVSITPRPLSTPGKDSVPIVHEAGWAPGSVWTGAENLALTWIRYPDRPARSQSLYRVSYPAHGTGRSIDNRQTCRSQNWRKNYLFGSHTNRTTTLPNTGRYPNKETTKSLTIASKEEAWKMEAAVVFVMWQHYNRQHGVMTQKSVFFKNRAHS